MVQRMHSPLKDTVGIDALVRIRYSNRKNDVTYQINTLTSYENEEKQLIQQSQTRIFLIDTHKIY